MRNLLRSHVRIYLRIQIRRDSQGAVVIDRRGDIRVHAKSTIECSVGASYDGCYQLVLFDGMLTSKNKIETRRKMEK